MAVKLRKGINVMVLSGKSRGKSGRILAVDREKNRVIVEGVNVIRRASRPTQANPSGGFVEREAPIHASNVAALDPDSNHPSRIGFKIEDGRKVRISRKSGKAIEAGEAAK